ncbi:hypothetical protein [Comamonas sp. BIGb0124]|uniref:hypothetical protein n=1 Tax=Comamonas sp. BIGb0124 TaxID=2485130 RepID=UPI0013155CF9|nr:hypothetical protein [Comamonas sp. BIGb0124]
MNQQDAEFIRKLASCCKAQKTAPRNYASFDGKTGKNGFDEARKPLIRAFRWSL